MNGFVWNIKTEEDFLKIIRQEYRTVTHNFCNKEKKGEVWFNKKITFLNDHEKELTEAAIKSKRTTLTIEEVDYYINEYGARGDWSLETFKPEHINIAVFGCSFTFGTGLPESKIWAAQVQKNLPANRHINLINLGFPGGCITKSLKLFTYLTDVCKVDLAIFLLPTHWREEYPVFYTLETPVRYANLIPDFKTTQMYDVWETFYKYSTEGTRLYDAIKNIKHIELVAKANKVETYYSSWDESLLNTIKPHIGKRQSLPYFKFIENMLGPHLSNKYARDGSHPGLATQDLFAKEVVDHLISVSDVEGIIKIPKII
jgi:hypothetical protein